MSRKCKDWLDSYMIYTDNSEPPKLYHMWVAISTIAAALQRKCVLRWGPINFFPNMYIVLCGPPGRCRKGTAMSYGSNFLSRLEVKLAAESTTRESLVRAIKEAQESEFDEATNTLTFHSSLTVFAQELTVFLGYNNQQLMMDLTDWFDCGRGPDGLWTYRTKHQGTDDIVGIWVNLIGATTPGLLRSCLSMDAIGGGLTSRIIFVYEENKFQSCPMPMQSDEVISLGEDLYYDLEQIHLMKGVFKYTKEFVALWKKWYTEADKNHPFTDAHLAPYCERRPVHIMKLSMILSACRSNEMVVTDADLARAIAIIERTERNMGNTFSGIGKSPHAEVLTRIMNEIGLAGIITVQELQQKFYQDADARVLELMIQTLENTGFVLRSTDGSTLKWNRDRRATDEIS